MVARSSTNYFELFWNSEKDLHLVKKHLEVLSSSPTFFFIFWRDKKKICLKFLWSIFLFCWPLDAGIGYFWPEHRILHEVSSLGTGPEVPILKNLRPKIPPQQKIAERLAKSFNCALLELAWSILASKDSMPMLRLSFLSFVAAISLSQYSFREVSIRAKIHPD